MTDDKDRWVMGLARSDTDAVPGSVQITATCGHTCWISPDGMRMLMRGEHKVETSCIPCIDLSKVDEMQAVPGAFDTVEALLGKHTSTHLRGLLEAYNEARRRRGDA